MLKTRRRSLASATLNLKTPQQDSNLAKNTGNRRSPFSATAVVTASAKSVLLVDWWLLKAKGKGLAVGGVDSRETLGVRGFSSAAICKRHTSNVLETEDGVMITVTGFLNTSRTHENGFSCELYNHFLLGFPNDWEDYAACVSGVNSTDIGASMRNSPSLKLKMYSGNNKSHSLPLFSNDLPVTRLRDIMMVSSGETDYRSLAKDIFSDLLRTTGDTTFQHTGSSIGVHRENSTPVKVGSGTGEAPTQPKKVQGNKDIMTDKNAKSSQEFQWSRRRPSHYEPACTRSRSRTNISTEAPTKHTKIKVQNDKDAITDDNAKDSQKSARENACTVSRTRTSVSTPIPVRHVDFGTTDTPSKHKKVKLQDDKKMITDDNAKSRQKSARPGKRSPTFPEPACTRSRTRKNASTPTIQSWKSVTCRTRRNVSEEA